MSYFEFSSTFDHSLEELFSWYERKGIICRLIPPWEDVKVIREPDNLQDAEATFILNITPFIRFVWHAKHTDYIRYKQFKDIQLKGPFRRWEHTHIFNKLDENSSLLKDVIYYEPMFNMFLIPEKLVASKLKRTFRYRYTITKNDLSFISKYNNSSPMNIAIAGSNGTIGRELVPILRSHGHRVYRIVRTPSTEKDTILFDIEKGVLKGNFDTIDTVINLAGAPIAEGRWTVEKLRDIENSRIFFTKQLIKALSQTNTTNLHFINASAIGYYGENNHPLDEQGPKGKGYIAELCHQWEESAKNDLFKTTILRIGVVLTPKGGALKKLLSLTKYNLSAVLGSGNQFISWISIDDVIYAICHIIYNKLTGVFNITAPNPVTQKELVDILSKRLKKVRFLTLNEHIVKTLYGTLGTEILLSSCRAIPEHLTKTSFTFYFPQLNSTIDHLLGVVDE
ncbi:MAG: TIGR01777 family oxidoreductase [Calditerrivibrio sp.]|nr:TIGR01777 family oxidoreductase [Calditerrivibrio sp.]